MVAVVTRGRTGGPMIRHRSDTGPCADLGALKPYYADDLVTLYQGDCRSLAGIWTSADVLVTDPPYGISWPSGALHSNRDTREASGAMSIAGDADTSVRDDVLALWDGPAIVFGTWRKPRPAGTTHRLIWSKMGRHPGVAPSAIFPTDEEIYLLGSGWVGPPKPTVITTHEQRSGKYGAAASVGHPTPKPVGLMEQLITKCPPGVIADPFAGSGATLIAARNLGRNAIGVELEPKYCELIANRLRQAVMF